MARKFLFHRMRSTLFLMDCCMCFNQDWHLSMALWLPCLVEEVGQVQQQATTSRHQLHPSTGTSSLTLNIAPQSTQRMVMTPFLTLSILSARKLKHKRHRYGASFQSPGCCVHVRSSFRPLDRIVLHWLWAENLQSYIISYII